MKKLRTGINRFFLRHRNKGIPNLMLFLSLGSGIVYLMSEMAGNYILYDYLCFDYYGILRGEVWRLISFPLTYGVGNPNLLLVALGLFCYYSLGRAIENTWGTLKFNLFYFVGVVLTDIFCMIFRVQANVYSLNLSLLISYATLYSDAQFLVFFILPIKAWILALIDLGLVMMDVFSLYSAGWPFPQFLFPLISIANYFLFFGRDVVNILPPSWRSKLRRKPVTGTRPKVVQFEKAGPYKPTPPKKEDFIHRCTVCGRTDVSNPELEFRYCSRCSGYHCYCEDHISDHTHIQ